MCGIVGFVAPRDDRLLHAMNACQEHRGPDDGGVYVSPDGGVSMAMRRLSIIDLADGHQPMANASGSRWIVFNGEIFNAPELRRQLTARGHRFRTDHSDTEVLVHLYDEFGAEMVHHLNGMFAFVIYDDDRRLVFGARDRFGIKPLYLARGDRGALAFSSELRSLRVVPWIDHEIDEQAIFDYFTLQCVPAPRSPWRAVQKLPHASRFTYSIDCRQMRVDTYWQPRFDGGACSGRTGVNRRDVGEHVLEQLDGAVSRWSLSDVPVATLLSGGLDSSLITALAARRSQSPLFTFTLGFESEGADIDERHLARETAQRYGTTHHEIVLTSGGLLAALPSMVHALDEPYAGGLPSWFVFQAVGAAGMKVALTGVGGDEVIGNYHKWVRYSALRSRMARRLRRNRPMGYERWPHASLYIPRYIRDDEKRVLLRPDRFSECSPTEDHVEELWTSSASQEPRDAIASVDLRQQLPNEFLLMVDRFSMAFSVEARTPFLDNQFVDAVLALPPSWRTDRNTMKKALVAAGAEVLPPSLLTAPKRGFVVPVSDWMRGPLKDLVRDVTTTEHLADQGLFTSAVVRDLVDPFFAGNDALTTKLWTLLMFQLWYREHA